MAGILIAYSTIDGQTRRICERLQRSLEAGGQRVTLAELGGPASIDIRPFDKVVVGASIRYGKHRSHVYRFAAENAAALADRPNAFFSVNLEARKPGMCSPETNPYLRKFLAETPWQPKHVAVSAGRLGYSRYGFWDRTLVRLIMRYTGGPTEGDTEYTDWNQVDAFARLIGGM